MPQDIGPRRTSAASLPAGRWSGVAAGAFLMAGLVVLLPGSARDGQVWPCW